MTSPTLALLPTGPLPAAEVAALEAATRANLGSAIANLAALRAGQAHTTAGFTTWAGYALDRFGDLLRELALPVADRRELVEHLRREENASLATIATRLGVSKSTAKNDVHALEGDAPGALATTTVARDGRRLAAVGDRSPRRHYTPAAHGSVRAAILAALAALGPLAAPAVRDAVERPEGSSVAAALADLRRAGRVTYTPGAKRGQHGLYALVPLGE